MSDDSDLWRAMVQRDQLLINDILEEKNKSLRQIESALNSIILHNHQFKEFLHEFALDIERLQQQQTDIESRVRTIEYRLKNDETIRRLLVNLTTSIYHKLFGQAPEFIEGGDN